MLFAVPIMAGMASFIDIERLELYDWFQMNEILMVKHENESRANKHAERKAKSGAK